MSNYVLKLRLVLMKHFSFYSLLLTKLEITHMKTIMQQILTFDLDVK